jgi:glucose dehydrogenase
MRPLRLVLAVILAVVGLAWIGQGSGVIGGSAMTGSSFWAVAGVVLLVVAAGLGILEFRHARTARPRS